MPSHEIRVPRDPSLPKLMLTPRLKPWFQALIGNSGHLPVHSSHMLKPLPGWNIKALSTHSYALGT